MHAKIVMKFLSHFALALLFSYLAGCASMLDGINARMTTALIEQGERELAQLKAAQKQQANLTPEQAEKLELSMRLLAALKEAQQKKINLLPGADQSSAPVAGEALAALKLTEAEMQTYRDALRIAETPTSTLQKQNCKASDERMRQWLKRVPLGYQLNQDKSYMAMIYLSGVCRVMEKKYSEAERHFTYLADRSVDADIKLKSQAALRDFSPQLALAKVQEEQAEQVNEIVVDGGRYRNFGTHDLPLWYSLHANEPLDLNICLQYEKEIPSTMRKEVMDAMVTEFSLYDIQINFPINEAIQPVIDHGEWAINRTLEKPCDRNFLLTNSYISESIARQVLARSLLVGVDETMTKVVLSAGGLFTKTLSLLLPVPTPNELGVRAAYHAMGCEYAARFDDCYQQIARLKKLRMQYLSDTTFFPAERQLPLRFLVKDVTWAKSRSFFYPHQERYTQYAQINAPVTATEAYREFTKAVRMGDNARAKTLIENGFDFKTKAYSLARSPFAIAVFAGNTEMVQLMLDKGMGRVEDERGRNALYEILLQASQQIGHEEGNAKKRMQKDSGYTLLPPESTLRELLALLKERQGE